MARSPEFPAVSLKGVRVVLAEFLMCMSVGSVGVIAEQTYDSVLNRQDGVIYREAVKNINTYTSSRNHLLGLQIPQPYRNGDLERILIAVGEGISLAYLSGKVKGSAK